MGDGEVGWGEVVLAHTDHSNLKPDLGDSPERAISKPTKATLRPPTTSNSHVSPEKCPQLLTFDLGF